MPIVKVNEPIWNSRLRQWIINYIVFDNKIGEYVQTVKCEALVSAQNMFKEIKGKIR